MTKDANTPATKADLNRLEDAMLARFDCVDEKQAKLETKTDSLERLIERNAKAIERNAKAIAQFSVEMNRRFEFVQITLDALVNLVNNNQNRLEELIAHEKRIARLERHVGLVS